MSVIYHWSEMDQKFWINHNDEVLWFDSVLACKEAASRIEIEQAVQEERAKIVAWLRSADWLYDNHLADAIEAGEHLK